MKEFSKETAIQFLMQRNANLAYKCLVYILDVNESMYFGLTDDEIKAIKDKIAQEEASVAADGGYEDEEDRKLHKRDYMAELGIVKHVSDPADIDNCGDWTVLDVDFDDKIIMLPFVTKLKDDYVVNLYVTVSSDDAALILESLIANPQLSWDDFGSAHSDAKQRVVNSALHKDILAFGNVKSLLADWEAYQNA